MLLVKRIAAIALLACSTAAAQDATVETVRQVIHLKFESVAGGAFLGLPFAGLQCSGGIVSMGGWPGVSFGGGSLILAPNPSPIATTFLVVLENQCWGPGQTSGPVTIFKVAYRIDMYRPPPFVRPVENIEKFRIKTKSAVLGVRG